MCYIVTPLINVSKEGWDIKNMFNPSHYFSFCIKTGSCKLVCIVGYFHIYLLIYHESRQLISFCIAVELCGLLHYIYVFGIALRCKQYGVILLVTYT